MKSLINTLRISVFAVEQAVAQFKFTHEATFKGKPVPQSEIKVVPFETPRKSARVAPAQDAKFAHKKTRRANPTSVSANWCGSVNHGSPSNQIKIVHTSYQHPACSKRTGVTSYPQVAAVWAGIDGDSVTTAILQAGTTCKVSSTGAVTYVSPGVPDPTYYVSEP